MFCLLFWDRVLLCIPCCAGSQDPFASASRGLHACAHHPWGRVKFLLFLIVEPSQHPYCIFKGTALLLDTDAGVWTQSLPEFRTEWAKGSAKLQPVCAAKSRRDSFSFTSCRGRIDPSLPLHPPPPKQISWKTFWLHSHPLGKATCTLSQSAVSLRFTARWAALMARRWRSAQLSSFQASSHKDELLALLPPGGCCRHIACPWKYGFPAVQIIELCRTPYLVLSPRSTADTDLVQFLVSAFLCECCARDSLQSEARSKLEE